MPVLTIDRPVSALRRCMIEDVAMRGLRSDTQHEYIRFVRSFAAFLGQPLDTATAGDIRRFQVRQRESGVQPPTIDCSVSALRFFFTATLDRPDLSRRLVLARYPREPPAVLSVEDAGGTEGPPAGRSTPGEAATPSGPRTGDRAGRLAERAFGQGRVLGTQREQSCGWWLLPRALCGDKGPRHPHPPPRLAETPDVFRVGRSSGNLPVLSFNPAVLRAECEEETDRRGRDMFASIRKYKVRRGAVEELARRVQEGFVPLMREVQGFESYYLLDGGPDVLITISIFDSADAALASNATAADWVRNNVLEFTRGMPEVMVGNALVAEVKEHPAACIQ
jgi:hypothetical protein